jgi:predicted DsbA family dithiol-disulfide isomerase
VRLRLIEEEFAGLVRVEWRSFLLRPRPTPGRSLEKFREYTQSWLRPAADPDGGTFRVGQSDAGPPSHSVPPHLLAKAAATIGEAEFHRIHDKLLHAYFAENRDITDPATLRAIWEEVGLPASEFARCEDPELARAVVHQHNEAIEWGVTGVPAVRIEGREGVVIGAQPLALYRRWIRRSLG